MLLTDHTFRDTGITVKIRKISPMMAADVANAIPEPKPPLQEVDYGEPKGKVMEPNYSDPAYLAAKTAHQKRIFEVLQRVMIRRAVKVPGDEWQDEVREYREFIKEQTGVELDEPDDLVVYILRICVGSEDDLTELLTAITSRSQPTAEAIEKAKDSF